MTTYPIDPFFPFSLAVSVCATVDNDGDAELPVSQLLLGESSAGIASYSPPLNLPVIAPGSSSTVCNVLSRLSGAGRTSYVAIFDPVNRIRESNEKNNRAAVAVAF